MTLKKNEYIYDLIRQEEHWALIMNIDIEIKSKKKREKIIL